MSRVEEFSDIFRTKCADSALAEKENKQKGEMLTKVGDLEDCRLLRVKMK